MAIKKIKRLKLRLKIFLLVSGVIIAVILLEAGLQLSGFIGAHVFLPRYDFSEIAPGEKVIFCLGDSYTYGIGAGKENSYPVQLEEILNKRIKGSLFKVYNLGVPGYNSAQVLKKLRAAITSYKPDVVVVLCGGNDSWNFSGMELQLGSSLTKILFTRLKIFKMASVISENLRHIGENPPIVEVNNRKSAAILKQENNAHKLIQYGNVYRQHGFFSQAEAFYSKAGNSMKHDPLVSLELGRCYKLAKQYIKAIDVLERGLNNYPNDNEFHYELQDVFLSLKSDKETILFYKQFLLKFPENLSARKFLAATYLRMGGEYYLNNQAERAIEYYNNALVFDPKRKKQINSFVEVIKSNERRRKEYFQINLQSKSHRLSRVIEAYYFTSSSGQRIAGNVLEENLGKMAEICKKNNINIFFSGYPSGVSEAMENVALSSDVVVIDHKESFDGLLKQYKNEDIFVSDKDKHCTKLGYRRMAENISEAILSVMPHETEEEINIEVSAK